MFEPVEFAAMRMDPLPFVIEPEEVAASSTLAEDNEACRAKVHDAIQGWQPTPSNDVINALRVIGLYVQEKFVWHASNDILLTRLVELLFHAEFRAHPDGVYEYKAGHWPKIDEFNYRTIRRLEKVLGYASFFFKAFIDMETRREWDCVFECVQLVYQGALSATAVDATTFLRGPKCKCVWGAEGGRVIWR